MSTHKMAKNARFKRMRYHICDLKEIFLPRKALLLMEIPKY